MELRLEGGRRGLDGQHHHVPRQVGVERQTQPGVGDRRAAVDVGHHRQRVHAGVGAPRRVDAAVPAGQRREGRLDGALDGALTRRLPLPPGEAGPVVLEQQAKTPHRRAGPRTNPNA
jgi:hypothetical protein